MSDEREIGHPEIAEVLKIIGAMVETNRVIMIGIDGLTGALQCHQKHIALLEARIGALEEKRGAK